jgi:hypothetical protein
VGLGCGACGCGVTYPAHSGGPGSPSDPTTGVCHSCWLDVALVNGGKPSGSAECGALRLCPEERSRGQKSPRWCAVRRCAVAACRRSGGADRDKTTLCASRRAATPHVSRGDYPNNSGSLSRENANSCVQNSGCLTVEERKRPRSSFRGRPGREADRNEPGILRWLGVVETLPCRDSGLSLGACGADPAPE